MSMFKKKHDSNSNSIMKYIDSYIINDLIVDSKV